MSIIDYPLSVISPECPPRPLLPIRIANPNEEGLVSLTYGLIDTGADDIVIPGSIAKNKKLWHNIKDGTQSFCSTGNGVADVYHHSFSLEIYIVDENKEMQLVDSLINRQFGVMENLPCILLGVEGFLSQYKLTIDYPEGVFSLIK